MRISTWKEDFYIEGLVQDCSDSIANALELLQSCIKPSILNYALQGPAYPDGMAVAVGGCIQVFSEAGAL